MPTDIFPCNRDVNRQSVLAVFARGTKTGTIIKSLFVSLSKVNFSVRNSVAAAEFFRTA